MLQDWWKADTQVSLPEHKKKIHFSISGSSLLRAPLILIRIESLWKCANIKIMTLKGCGRARGPAFLIHNQMLLV